MLISDLDIFLGKKIRFYRGKYRWPLKTLADEIGFSLQQLQRYEQGENKISASLLYKFASVFNVKIDAFFEGLQQCANGNQVGDAKNILLIEDDNRDEFLLRKALEEFPEPLSIYSIHDCAHALEFFRKLGTEETTVFPKPQLIFLDLFMPHGNGLELLSDIKRRPILKDIPVIVLTNSVNVSDIKESYKLQASGFIRKSLDFNEFKSQLFKTLNYWINTVMLP